VSRPNTFPIVLAGFTAFLNLYATQPLLPLLMSVFGASHVAVSLTITAATVAVALAAPFAGRLADSIGRKRVIVWSAVVLAAATALASTSASLPQLIAWRFVQGLATPGIFAVTISYIHEEFPAARMGSATAWYVSGTVVGGFCGRAVTGIVAAGAGWRTALVVLGALNLAAAAAVWKWLPRERSAASPRARRRGSVQRVLGNQQLLATYGVGVCVLFTQVAMFTYVTFHLEAPPYGLSTAALGSLFVVYLVGAAVMPVAGPSIDRYGHRASLAFGMGAGAVGAMLTLAPSLAAIVAGLALVATGVFITQATASSYIGAVTVEDRGLAVGLYAMFYYAGGSLGAAVPGAFWDNGGWRACVALVIVVQALTVLLATAFWKPRPGESAVPETGV
jgi:MFS transporter, YNFM family, putative membrane transport protein